MGVPCSRRKRPAGRGKLKRQMKAGCGAPHPRRNDPDGNRKRKGKAKRKRGNANNNECLYTYQTGTNAKNNKSEMKRIDAMKRVNANICQTTCLEYRELSRVALRITSFVGTTFNSMFSFAMISYFAIV